MLFQGKQGERQAIEDRQPHHVQARAEHASLRSDRRVPSAHVLLFAGCVFFLAARVLYLFLPLLVSAALAGVVFGFDLLPALRRPIDAGLSFRGRRVFGDSKTWRGVVVAVAGSIGTVALQRAGAAHTVSLALVDYRGLNPVCFGMAMGGGAMLGELPNSFVKRRLGIPPGGTSRGWRGILFYVWDQVDLLTGAWPLLLAWICPGPLVVVVSFALALGVHPLIALVGYLVRARKSPR